MGASMELVQVNGLGGYVTVEQAARLLHMTESGVHKLVRRRNVPFVRLGHYCLLLRPADLAAQRDAASVGGRTQ